MGLPVIPERWRPVAALLVTAAIILGFYRVHLDATMMQSGGDFANLFWPMKLHVQRAWADGVVALWNPYSYLGTPLAASMQHGVFYPVEWPLLRLPAHRMLAMHLLLHLVWAGWGTTLLLARILRGAWLPAVAFGWIYPCCQWFWGHQEHINQVASAAWIPWQVLIVWNGARERMATRRFIGAYAGVSALQFLTGHPQEAFYGHLLAGALWVALHGHGGGWRVLPRTVAVFAAAGGLFLLLAAVQVLPMRELESLSIRQFRDENYAHSYSMPPDLLKVAIDPHAFGSFVSGYVADSPDGPVQDLRAYGEYGLFIGWPVLLLALLAPLLHRRRLTLFLAVGVVLVVLLAMGGNTAPARMMARDFTEFTTPGASLYDLFITLVPPARGLRVPARIIIVGLLAVVLLAALGADALRHRLGRWGGALLLPACALVTAVQLERVAALEKFRHPVPVEPLLGILRESQSLSQRSIDDRLFRLWMLDDQLLAKNERELATTRMHGNPLMLRYRRLQPGMHIAAMIPMEDGYEEGLVPTARTKDFLTAFNRHFRSERPDAQFLALLGIGRLWSDPPIDAQVFPAITDGPEAAWRMHRNPLHRGATFWLESANGVDWEAFDGAVVRTGDPALGFHRGQALLPYGAVPRWNMGGATLRTALPNGNRVEVSSFSAPEDDAILTMGNYPGWRIIMPDGSREPLEWLNAVHAFIPQAAFDEQHTVTLAYEPASYRIGLFLSAGALGVMLLLLLSRGRSTQP